jgi:hypothetical protein
MFKIEIILDERLLTDAEAQVLPVEAQYPGAMSKPILKTVVSSGVLDQEEWLVSRVEHLNVTEDNPTRDLILSCPVLRGLQVNEMSEDCDGCARRQRSGLRHPPPAL